MYIGDSNNDRQSEIPIVAHCCNHLATLFRLAMVENPRLAIGISTLFVIVRVVYLFPVLMAMSIISRCRSMLSSLVDTFCEIALMMTYYYFGFVRHLVDV